MAKNEELSSSKCDFKFNFGKLNFSGQQIGKNTHWRSESPTEQLRVQADKCDYQLSLQRNNANLRMDSDKCDWRLEGIASGLTARMDSDKCDFRIRSTVERALPVRIDTVSPGSDVAVSSSKCDWKIKAVGALKTAAKRPELNASLSADKCDFRMQIEFGIAGGKMIRIDAVSSSKCDFRIIGQQEKYE